jgi:glycosyltransferase involved in cell wall biosynthesis
MTDRSPEEAPELTALDLPRDYVFFVGTIEPRKNLPTLFKAFAQLPEGTRRAFPLILAGHRGWRTEPIYAAAEALVREGTLRFLGGVPDALLRALYTRAALFVFPSLEEGFGLPPLEAMACGTPVVISDAPALVEVCGPAAVVVPRIDVAALTGAMQRLLSDLDERRRLGEAGRRHAAQFTWERTAKQTLEVYRRVLGGP